MDIYTVLSAPHPTLKTKSPEVDRVDDALRAQMDKMLQTMYADNGIGLAANQVDILNRVLVMDLDWRKCEDHDCGDAHEGNPIFMVNPKIIHESEQMSEMDEGCLSVPGHYAKVERPAIVRVKYLDYDGKEQEMEADGLLSHCVQHEIDHLDGVLFVDHLSSLKRNMIMKKMKKAQKANIL
jgi:peptide deformylase